MPSASAQQVSNIMIEGRSKGRKRSLRKVSGPARPPPANRRLGNTVIKTEKCRCTSQSSEWATALAAWEEAEAECDGRQQASAIWSVQRQQRRRSNFHYSSLLRVLDSRARQGANRAFTTALQYCARSEVLRQWAGPAPSYGVWHQERLFDRRCERLAWHVDTAGRQRLAASSHGGDVVLSAAAAAAGQDWSKWELIVR